MTKNPSELPAPPGVGLVQKVLQILDLFQADAANWSQGEIAVATNIPKSTVNRLVKFLTGRGYLALLQGQNRYSLGPASIDLGQRASARFEFRSICRPLLERLSQETGETVILTTIVASGNAVRCVDQIESTREGLRVFEQIGSIFPLHAGAAPKAVLAVLKKDEQDRYLSRQLAEVTGHTMVDPAALREDIRQSIAQGYAVSNGETYEGVVGVGAAFFRGNGHPAGSLAIAIPSQRATPETISNGGVLLKAICAEVTAVLSAERADHHVKDAT